MNRHWTSSSDAQGFSLTMRCHNCSWGIVHIYGPNELPCGLVIASRHLRNVSIEKKRTAVS
jgi:hypothetical protein